jgi:K+-sensing histidine kinase KdpD
MVQWVITIILVFFAGFQIWANPTEFSFAFYACIASFAIAALLMLPPLWHWQTDRIWQRARYVAVVILVIAGFLMPIKTTAIKLDMPNSASHLNS